MKTTFTYNNKQKETIGKLFKYYRKKYNRKWMEIENAHISSNQTYLDLENGIAKKNNDIYDLYANFYNQNIRIKENFEEWFNKYLNNIFTSFVYNKSNEYSNLLSELNSELEHFKEFIYYKENYQILIYLFNYYTESILMNKEEVLDMLDLLNTNVIDNKLQILLLEVMFVSNNNKIGLMELENIIFDSIFKFKNEPLLQYVISIHEMHLSNLNIALSTIKANYKYWKEHNNDYRSTKCLIGYYSIAHNVDDSQTRNIENELLELKKSKFITSSMKKSINFNIAINHYMEHDYLFAKELLLENINNYKCVKEPLYICSIDSQTGNEITEAAYLNTSPYYDKYLYFYRLVKEKADSDILVKAIIKEILPQLEKHEKYVNPFWKMFEEELLLITKKQRKYYKDYFLYIEKMKKNCKNM